MAGIRLASPAAEGRAGSRLWGNVEGNLVRVWRRANIAARTLFLAVLLTATACDAGTTTVRTPETGVAVASLAPPLPSAAATATSTQSPAFAVASVPVSTATPRVTTATALNPTTTAAATRPPETVTAVAQTANPTNQARRTDDLQATTQAEVQGTPPPPTATPRPLADNATVAATAAQPILTMVPTPQRSPVPNIGTPRSLPSAEGEYVSIGERRLWMACRGDGGPTVILESGINTGSSIWQFVLPGIATTTRVCAYDRAGIGRSSITPRPRDSQQAVDDLHGLLVNAGIPGPYVLVAHSFGGLNARLFQSEFPNEVLGMVLVDTVHEDRFAATAKILTPEQEREFEQGRGGTPNNPAELNYYRSSDLVRKLGHNLPDIPLAVIARGRAEAWPPGYPAEALERVWRDLQKDLAARAPQGKLLIAEQANHNIPGEQPQIVIDATRSIVNQLRMRGR